MGTNAELDIGPLTWVKGEIDLALERADEALDRHQAEGASGGESSHLKSARNNLHQAHGALSIVGLDGVTQFSDALEHLFAAIDDGSVDITPDVLSAAKQGLSAIRHYLDDLVAGEPDQSLKLLPAYRALFSARGLPEPTAAELFFPDLSLRPPRREREPETLAAAELIRRVRSARIHFERGLLQWLRRDTSGLSRMREAVAAVELTQVQTGARAFWWAALGFIDGLAAGSLGEDLTVKRLCGRIDIQMKRLAEGNRSVAERLMRDTLYQVAVAGPLAGDQAACVRAAYRLDGLVPKPTAIADADKLRPVLRASHELLAQAMEDWNRFCAGAAAALPQFHERLGRFVTQVQSLQQGDISRLVGSLAAVADLLRKNPLRHDESIAIEVATALLLAEHAVDAYEHLGEEFSDQVATVVARLSALLQGKPLGTLEVPHLDEISKKAQERLLMNQVVKEIGVNLGVIEQTLDAFFRDPAAKGADLAKLPKPLKQVEGALVILGQERARAIFAECERAVAGFSAEGYQPRQADFEDVAKKLSAIGFFVEQLKFGQADIDAILDPAPSVAAPTEEEEERFLTSGLDAEIEATARVTQTMTLVEALREKPEDAGLREEIKQNLESLREDAWLVADAAVEEKAAAALSAIEAAQPADMIGAAVAGIAPTPVATAAPSAEASRLAEASSEEIDAELLAIFIEEAHEVLASIDALLPVLAAQPHDTETLTTIRRGFHTLKGSGRMVGLAELGEVAWAVEQVLNRWLRQELDPTPVLQQMIAQAQALFSDWVSQLEAGGATGKDASALVTLCEHLKSEDGATAPAQELIVPPPAAEPPAPAEPEQVQIGDVSLSPALYDMYIKEARGHILTLQRELEAPTVPGNPLVRAAHTLAGISATAGIGAVNGLGHALEGALNRFAQAEAVPADNQRLLLARAVGALEGMVGAVSERRLPPREEALTRELEALVPVMEEAPAAIDIPALLDDIDLPEDAASPAVEEITLGDDLLPPMEEIAAAVSEAEPAPEPQAAEAATPLTEEEPAAPLRDLAPSVGEASPFAGTADVFAALVDDAKAATALSANKDDLDRRQQRLEDELDDQLLPIFLEEAEELIRDLGTELRSWREDPDNRATADQLKRLLHTFKGSARMAGAMGLGELLHSMETRIEQALEGEGITPAFLDKFDTSFDRVSTLLEQIRNPSADIARIGLDEEAAEDGETEGAGEDPEAEETAEPAEPVAEAAFGPTAEASSPAGAPQAAAPTQRTRPAEPDVHASRAMLRVRADLVDKLVNEAGEMAIARGRIEGEMRSLKSALLDLTENVIRLRNQLREVEIQAESQMQSRQAQTVETNDQFDPLEFDRFTRFQELTRMMAESVNDVGTVQQSLLRNLDHADASITAQARLNRELSQSLMSVRMVPFNTIADRLYRLVRQTAKELDKRANLDIRGGQTELDRSVLEKMTGPLEHLLRNSVSHGIETPEIRAAAGKPELGQITLTVAQSGNEVTISIEDDGAGLDFAGIRTKAINLGLLAADAQVDEQQLTQFIFQSGFSTAQVVTEVSGRGVGMDVVRNDTASLGGRIEARSVGGQGTHFDIFLPLTLAITQAVLVSVGQRTYAIPASMVEQVSELKPEVMEAIRKEGATNWLGTRFPWNYLPRLLGDAQAQPETQRRYWLLLLKSGTQHIAVEVDSLLGNQEIVVKNIGAQLARVVGISGATVLGSGEIALIVNPVALAGREQRPQLPAAPQAAAAPEVALLPQAAQNSTVMVVDDSLTVRKITGRLLAREGYHVLTAKDGVDALEQLLDVIPAVMLVDIEMPRMDGFDLTRNVRADDRLKDIPIIMITSRTADKHRKYAEEIGVNHYLGKPYDEDELLGLIAGYVGRM